MIEQKITELTNRINELDRHYYGEGSSLVSDKEYDLLYKELLSLESANPQCISPNSPTQRVGNDLSDGFSKVEHKTRMMSIDNSYSSEDVFAWVNRTKKLVNGEEIQFTGELKMDGIACTILYENGVLTKAVTRGNGSVGDDITANVKTIRTIPLTIPNLDSIEVRGEIYMRFEMFQKLNARLEDDGKAPMQNPRNTTAGTIKLRDPKEVSKRNLSFGAYYLLENDLKTETHIEAMEKLEGYGFEVVTHSEILNSAQDVVDYCLSWDQKRHDLPYPVDGMVFKVNSRNLYETLGSTSKAPRWIMAYKYEPAQVETTQ